MVSLVTGALDRPRRFQGGVWPRRTQGGWLWPRLLLPYLAVGLGWVAFGSAWAAIGCYHLGILALAGKDLGPRLRSLVRGGAPRRTIATVLLLPPAALIFLRWLPQLLRPGLDPGAWLESYGLSGSGLLILALIYGCLHPFLEEVHYQPLRARTPLLAHLSYAGYHGIVLYACFREWAVAGTVVSLAGVSFLFGTFERGEAGPRLSLLVHLVADLVVAAIALRWGGWF